MQHEEPARVIRHSRQGKPGRLPRSPLFPRKPSSLTRIDSVMQHRASAVGLLVSKAVLLWVDWEHAAPQAASTTIPWDAPFYQGKCCNSTHWEQKRGYHGDDGGQRMSRISSKTLEEEILTGC